MSGHHENAERILHIGKYFPPHRGGMETVLRDTMNIQHRAGIKVSAIVHSSHRAWRSECDTSEAGYPVHYAGRLATVFFSPLSLGFWWTLRSEIRRFRPDCIYVHMPNVSAFFLLLMRSSRAIPWVIYWHADVETSRQGAVMRLFHTVYRQFEKRLLKRAETIIVTSPPYLEHSNTLGPFKDRCQIEPIQLDICRIPESFRLGTQPARTNSEGLRILCVGRLTYYKDFLTAIRATAQLADATTRIIGEGRERASLEQHVDTLRVADRVHLLGEVTEQELWAQYQWCDVLCLPSIERTEAFGVVILEAAAFGKPSVVADTKGSGMGWVVEQVSPKGHRFVAGDEHSLVSILQSVQQTLAHEITT